MNKKLFILPLMAFLLAGCGGGGESGGGGGGGGGGAKAIATYDFTGLTEKGTEIATADAFGETLSSVCDGEDIVSSVNSISKLYDGNGQGGVFANASGFIKMGTGKVNGVIDLTLSKSIKKVVLNCHSFYASSTDYPTNTTNFISVNSGTAVAMPYNATGAGEDLSFEVSGTSLKIETSNPAPTDNTTAGRGYLFSITLYA